MLPATQDFAHHFSLPTAFKIVSIGLLLILAYQNKAKAQNTDDIKSATQAIYVDAGLIPIVAIHALVNFEKQLIKSDKIQWLGRLGMGVAANPDGGFGGLIGGTMLTGKRKDHLEANIGLFVGSEVGTVFTTPLIEIGYRYQKPTGGFLFKAKLGNLGLGFGIGYAF